MAKSLGLHDKMLEARERKKHEHLSRRKVVPLAQIEAARKFKHSRTGDGGGIVKKGKVPFHQKVAMVMEMKKVAKAFERDVEESITMLSRLSLSRAPNVTLKGEGQRARVVRYDFASPDRTLDEESKADTIRPAEITFPHASPSATARSGASSSSIKTTGPPSGVA